MIACTSPAGTCSDTPFRIGLSATVAWRFSIRSIVRLLLAALLGRALLERQFQVGPTRDALPHQITGAMIDCSLPLDRETVQLPSEATRTSALPVKCGGGGGPPASSATKISWIIRRSPRG